MELRNRPYIVLGLARLANLFPRFTSVLINCGLAALGSLWDRWYEVVVNLAIIPES